MQGKHHFLQALDVTSMWQIISNYKKNLISQLYLSLQDNTL